jgi:L-fucose isomerase-like protein
MGIIVSCEGDALGSITMALLACASLGQKVPFFGEFTIRHPTNKNGELLFHCGPFAYSLKKSGTTATNSTLREGFQVKDGNYTIARLDQDDGKYMLLAGNFKSIDGPYTQGTYLWAEFENLAKWERKLVEGPYIHHMAQIEGDYSEALKEFCKYIPSLNADWVE